MKAAQLATALYWEVVQDTFTGRHDPQCPHCDYCDPIAADGLACCPIHGAFTYSGSSGIDRMCTAQRCKTAVILRGGTISTEHAARILNRFKALLKVG